MDDSKIWFISKNISNDKKIKLLSMYNTEENIYNNINEILRLNFLTKSEKNSIIQDNSDFIKELLKKIKMYNTKVLTMTDDNYPKELINIYEPPYVLFCMGDLNLLNIKKVAMVGARNNTVYGEKVTKLISRELCKMQYGVVSGLAYGIDSVAHKEMLQNNGKTIAVLGNGLDIVYPKVNSKLYKDIAEKGLIISEYLFGTKPFKFNFPRRNRIISGISKAVIVVEASIKSGSLITANFALDEGKGVMAVPGSIFNNYSKGCNELIKDGAASFTNYEDLYLFLNEVKKHNVSYIVTGEEKEILQVIGEEPIHLDKIIKSVNIDRMALYRLLFEMQTKNKIICLPGNYYAKLS